MGMMGSTLAFVETVVPDAFGLAVLELGNQLLMPHVYNADGTVFRLGKKWWHGRGASRHVSLDINGLDGAMALDVSAPLPSEYREAFDVVTNFGFTEHVEDQWAVWRNVCAAVRLGGISLHELPAGPDAPGHLGCWFYRPEFFRQLAKAARWQIVAMREYVVSGWPVLNDGNMTCLQVAIRHSHGPFPDRQTFKTIRLEKVSQA